MIRPWGNKKKTTPCICNEVLVKGTHANSIIFTCNCASVWNQLYLFVYSFVIWCINALSLLTLTVTDPASFTTHCTHVASCAMSPSLLVLLCLTTSNHCNDQIQIPVASIFILGTLCGLIFSVLQTTHFQERETKSTILWLLGNRRQRICDLDLDDIQTRGLTLKEIKGGHKVTLGWWWKKNSSRASQNKHYSQNHLQYLSRRDFKSCPKFTICIQPLALTDKKTYFFNHFKQYVEGLRLQMPWIRGLGLAHEWRRAGQCSFVSINT